MYSNLELTMAQRSNYTNGRKMNTDSTCVYKPISNISPWLNDPSINDYVNCNFIPFNQNGIANNTYPWPNQPVWNHGNINHNHPAVNQISYIPTLINGVVQNRQMNKNVYCSNGTVYNEIQGFNTPNNNRNIFQNPNQAIKSINHKQGDVINVKSYTGLPASQDVNSYINAEANVKEEIDVDCNFIPFNQNGIANNTYPWPNQPIWYHENINHNYLGANQMSYNPPWVNGMVQNGQMNSNVYYSNGPVYNGIQGFNTPNHNRRIFHNQNKNNRNRNHKHGNKSSSENQDASSSIRNERTKKPKRSTNLHQAAHCNRETPVNTHIYFNDEEKVINAKPTSEFPENKYATTCNNKFVTVEEEIGEKLHALVEQDDSYFSFEEEHASPVELDTEGVVSNLEKENINLSNTPNEDENKKVVEAVVHHAEVKNHPVLSKYYEMRFALFSKFDEGIQLDEESWYSVTPEELAICTARRCRGDVIVDGFCGAGGNSIQFAFFAKKVIAIDIDPVKIALAKNNARVYGVEDRIEFICGSFLELAPTLQADVVFMSPPWGGPKYARQRVYDLEAQLLPVPFSKLMESARLISEDICAFLPRNSCRKQISQTAKGVRLEVEESFIKDKSIGTTVYFNKLARFVTRIDKPINKNKYSVKALRI